MPKVDFRQLAFWKDFFAGIVEPIACVYEGYNLWIINFKGERKGSQRMNCRAGRLVNAVYFWTESRRHAGLVNLLTSLWSIVLLVNSGNKNQRPRLIGISDTRITSGAESNAVRKVTIPSNIFFFVTI